MNATCDVVDVFARRLRKRAKWRSGPAVEEEINKRAGRRTVASDMSNHGCISLAGIS